MLSTDLECVVADSQLPEHHQSKDRQDCCTETGIFPSDCATDGTTLLCKYALTEILLGRQFEPEAGDTVRELFANLLLLLTSSPREPRFLLAIFAVLAREDFHGEVAVILLALFPSIAEPVGHVVEQGVRVVGLRRVIFEESGKEPIRTVLIRIAICRAVAVLGIREDGSDVVTRSRGVTGIYEEPEGTFGV